MARLSSKLRSVAFHINGSAIGIAHWCPGCNESHAMCTKEKTDSPSGRPIWVWNGDVDRPTITPSVKITYGSPSGSVHDSVCHYFLRDGSIQYLGDCTHVLANQTIALPDWPSDGDEASFYLPSPHDKIMKEDL